MGSCTARGARAFWEKWSLGWLSVDFSYIWFFAMLMWAMGVVEHHTGGLLS